MHKKNLAVVRRANRQSVYLLWKGKQLGKNLECAEHLPDSTVHKQADHFAYVEGARFYKLVLFQVIDGGRA